MLDRRSQCCWPHMESKESSNITISGSRKNNPIHLVILCLHSLISFLQIALIVQLLPRVANVQWHPSCFNFQPQMPTFVWFQLHQSECLTYNVCAVTTKVSFPIRMYPRQVEKTLRSSMEAASTTKLLFCRNPSYTSSLMLVPCHTALIVAWKASHQCALHSTHAVLWKHLKALQYAIPMCRMK